MTRVLVITSLIVELIKHAAELIKTFEVPGNGAVKKGIVLQMLETVFTALRERLNADIAWDSIKSIISNAIDAIVAFYNAVGIFRK